MDDALSRSGDAIADAEGCGEVEDFGRGGGEGDGFHCMVGLVCRRSPAAHSAGVRSPSREIVHRSNYFFADVESAAASSGPRADRMSDWSQRGGLRDPSRQR